jgi:site-specific DNA-methyltransferase (adenine-specific)
MNIQEIEINKVIPYSNNPRKNQDVSRVAKSIKDFGFQQPIVVDKDMVVIVGHTRLLGAKKLGLEQVPVVIADLDDAKTKAYRIADNRVNEDSGWDNHLLQHELNQLLNFDIDLSMTGFTNDELDSLFNKEEIDFIEPVAEVTQDDNHLLNDVKMIQLFYDPDNEKKFREIIEKLREKHKIDNISDAVLYCVLNEEKNLG